MSHPHDHDRRPDGPDASGWAPPSPPAAPLTPVDVEPAAGASRRRGRLALVALVGAGLGAGALVTGSVLVSADDDPGFELATAPPDDGTDDTGDDTGGDTGDGTGGDTSADTLGGVASCLAGELGIEPPTGTWLPDLDALAELSGAELQAAWESCAGDLGTVFDGTFGDEMFDGTFGDEVFDGEVFDEMFGELPALDDLPPLDELAACVEPIVGDVTAGWGELVPDVVVVGPDGPTLWSFGDGDGTVTITRSGGEVTVESSGDVTETAPEEAAVEAEGALDDLLGDVLGEGLDELLADLEACGLPVPDGSQD
jgi:hypothetical protein